MRNRTVIAILTVATALLAFILFFERGTLTTSERQSRKNHVFVGFKRDLVDRLAVRGSTGQEVVLERSKGGEVDSVESWRITSPRDLDADSSEAQSIISAIDFLLRDRAVKGSNVVADPNYGLATPRLSGSFSIRGEVTSFKVGADAKGGKVYLAIDGVEDEVYAVESDFLETMDKGVDDLRSKDIADLEIHEAVRVEVTRENGGLRLRRDPGGTWKVHDSGAWILAAEERVSELLGEVDGVRAERFVADNVPEGDLAKYGLGVPKRSIEVTVTGQEKVSLRVGDPCVGEDGQVHVTVLGSGTVACAEDDLLSTIDRPSSWLRETKIASFRRDEVDRISITRDGASLAMENGEDGWKIENQKEPALDGEAISELLNALNETRAEQIEIGKEAADRLGSPAAEVTLKLAEDAGEIRLGLFKGGSPGVEQVRRAGEDAVLNVPSGLIEKARPDPLAFRVREIEVGDKYDIEEIRIDGAAVQEMVKEDGVWKLVSPVSVEADGSAVRKLANLLAKIEVKRFVAAKAGPEHGFSEPFATVTARFVEEKEEADKKDRTGSKESILELGNEVRAQNGLRYARLKGGEEVVFAVGSEYEDAVAKPLVARDLLQVNVTDAKRLSFETGGQELVLSRQGDRWSRQGGGGSVDKDRLGRIVSDLEGLKAVGAVSFSSEEGWTKTPSATVRSWTESPPEKGEPEIFYVGPPSPNREEGGYLARKPGLGVTFVIPAHIVENLAEFVRTSLSEGADAGPS